MIDVAAGDKKEVRQAIDVFQRRGTDGELLWQAYDFKGQDNAAYALELDGAGGVYVTGTEDPDGNHSNFNDNFYTVKRDAATGAFLWSHGYGVNCIGCYDVPSDVRVDSAGNVFVAGVTSSPPYSSEMITVRSESHSAGSYRHLSIRSASMNSMRSSASFDAVSRYVVWSIQV